MSEILYIYMYIYSKQNLDKPDQVIELEYIKIFYFIY